MAGSPKIVQRIERLTPLADVLARIDRLVGAVASREVTLAAALGRTLAADVIAARGKPAVALALRDGFAVRAEETLDAGSYAPALLSATPIEVFAGEALPPGADAVMPLDAVVLRGAAGEALAPVAPGDGVLLAELDAKNGQVLCRAGFSLRAIDVAALRALGIERVTVRAPRLRVIPARRGDAVLDAAAAFICHAAAAEGVLASSYEPMSTPADALDEPLTDPDTDVVIVVGGTGTGRHDHSVAALARIGRLEVHGIAIAPGETAAFGMIETRPVLLVPGRLDAALALFVTLGRATIGRLAARLADDPPLTATLTRKVTSTIGLVELIPVRRVDGGVEPLASFYLPHGDLARADGLIVVAADREGFPAGASVAITKLP
jgi:molybdopterin molybdotransferase